MPINYQDIVWLGTSTNQGTINYQTVWAEYNLHVGTSFDDIYGTLKKKKDTKFYLRLKHTESIDVIVYNTKHDAVALSIGFTEMYDGSDEEEWYSSKLDRYKNYEVGEIGLSIGEDERAEVI